MSPWWAAVGDPWWWVLLLGVAGAVLALAPPAPRRLGPHRRASPRVDAVHRLLRGRPDAWPASTRTRWAVLTGLALVVLGLGVGLPPPAVVAGSALLAVGGRIASGLVESDPARRRRERLVHDLPEVCELLAAGLAAGLPLRTAVDAVTAVIDGPAAEDLRSVSALVAVGEPEPAAWRTLRDHPVWGPPAVDLARAVATGTPVGATLAVHAEQARATAREVRERRARSAGVRSVLPMMVCFLPAFFLIGIVPLVAGLVLGLLG